MAYELRPLSFSEILDRALWFYRDNFFLLFAIGAIDRIPYVIRPRGVTFRGHPLWSVVDLVSLLIVYPAATAVLIAVVASMYLGQSASISDAMRSFRGIWISYLGIHFLSVLLFLLMIATGGVAVIAVGALVQSGGLAALILSLFVGITLAAFSGELYFFVGWALADSVMVVERCRGLPALRRSRQLVAGSWWQMCGLVVAASRLSLLAYRTLYLLWGQLEGLGRLLISGTLAVLGTYITIFFVIYYFDRRCRLEDFDLRFLAEQVRAERPKSIATAPESSFVS
jgi:hypothetical protein